MPEQPDQLYPPPAERSSNILSYGFTGALGAVCGGAIGNGIGGEFFGEPNPELAQRDDLKEQASELRTVVQTEENVLDQLDDVMPPNHPVIVELKKDINANHAQITTLTTTADNIHVETSIEPIGTAIGATVGLAFFVFASWQLARRNLRIRLRTDY